MPRTYCWPPHFPSPSLRPASGAGLLFIPARRCCRGVLREHARHAFGRLMRTWSLAVSGSGGAGGKICDGRDKRVGGGRGDIDAFPGHDELVVDLQNLGDGGKVARERVCLSWRPNGRGVITLTPSAAPWSQLCSTSSAAQGRRRMCFGSRILWAWHVRCRFAVCGRVV